MSQSNPSAAVPAAIPVASQTLRALNVAAFEKDRRLLDRIVEGARLKSDDSGSLAMDLMKVERLKVSNK
jgi:hypothetical protein